MIDIPLTAKEKASAIMLQRKIEAENVKAAAELAKKAKYKIQIWFTSQRTSKKATAFTLSAWESGKRLHGGGDEMMFMCRRQRAAGKVTPKDVVAVGGTREATPVGCGGLISGGLAIPNGDIICPHCHTKHKTEHIGDSIYYNMTMDRASHMLGQWWYHLGGDADIYMKCRADDPRTRLMAQTMGFKKARQRKGLTIYPLAHIIKDTSAGQTLEGAFKAFLTA